MAEQQDVRVGAYFYPISTSCGTRAARARELNPEVNDAVQPIPSELLLARQARRLFAGHDQPKTYAIEMDGETVTDWDDLTDDEVFMQQTILARMHGISYFVIDAYTGLRDGRPVQELHRPQYLANRLTALASLAIGGFGYAKMEVLESPRALLPIQYKNVKQDGNFFAEPGRSFDVTPESARFIVKHSIADWLNPQYLQVNGRPYLSILMPTLLGLSADQKQHIIGTFIDSMRTYASQEYGYRPYLVGVMRQPSDIECWAAAGVDGTTQYCHLPDFGPDAPPIQDYQELSLARQADWTQLKAIAEKYGVPFTPAPALGWDASPRGEQSMRPFAELVGRHPYTPIVTGNTPERVADMLRAAIKFTRKNVSEGERFVTMFAWNELTEGASPIPRLVGGTLDYSYLHEIWGATRS